MSGSLTAPTPNIALNDFSGRRWTLATSSADGEGGTAQAIVVNIGAATETLTFEAWGSTITTGGTAKNAIDAPGTQISYIIIQNPPDSASQGIVTAENLFVKLDGAAVVNGATNFAVLAPGQSVTIGMPGLRPDPDIVVSVNAATTGHKYLATILIPGA
jgi:flagellar capping protein FliD